MPTITITQGHEYRTYVSDIYDKNAFYYPQYMQAGKCIDEIVARLDEFCEREKTMGRNSEYEDMDFDLYDDFSNDYNVMGYANNIIGFCAKRGQGKTSAMLALVKALVKNTGDKKVRENFWNRAHWKNRAHSGEAFSDDTKNTSPVLSKKFYALRSIDPTTMEKSYSILEIVLKRMFQKAEAFHREKQSDTRHGYRQYEDDYRDLLDQFQQMHKKLKELKNTNRPDPYDDISSIDETGDSRSTKYAFVNLVKQFLAYIESDVLIIPVDDADLTPTRVFEVAEDIRKYCVAPRVMVMMAVHLGTLRTCIEQEYVKNYSHLLQTSYGTDHMKKYQCREMAERYVDKLIPDMHQIHLPYIDDKVREGSNLTLEYRVPDYTTDLPDASKDLLNYTGVNSYQARLARLIYDKTGVILTERDGYLHNFMPRRYRELSHMLSFFTRLTDTEISSNYPLTKLIAHVFFDKLDLFVPNESKRKEWINGLPEILGRRTRNVEQLESFFFEHWCPIYLTKNQCAKLNKIRTVPLPLKNKQTIDILKAYCIRDHKDEFRGDVDVFPDTEKSITYGKILEVLSDIKKRLDSPFKFDFIYAVQMYYTIYLNKILTTQMENHFEHHFKDGKTDGTYPEVFKDILNLMGGIITPIQKGCSITYKPAITDKQEFWFISCDRNGIPSENEIWAYFDPFRSLFSYCGKIHFSEVYTKGIEHGEANQKDNHRVETSDSSTTTSSTPLDDQEVKSMITQTAWSLEYICNYDIQYYLFKNVIDRLPNSEKVSANSLCSALFGLTKDSKPLNRVVTCLSTLQDKGILKTEIPAIVNMASEECMELANEADFRTPNRLMNFVDIISEVFCRCKNVKELPLNAQVETYFRVFRQIPAFASFLQNCESINDVILLRDKLSLVINNWDEIQKRIDQLQWERFLQMEGGLEYLLDQIQEEKNNDEYSCGVLQDLQKKMNQVVDDCTKIQAQYSKLQEDVEQIKSGLAQKDDDSASQDS